MTARRRASLALGGVLAVLLALRGVEDAAARRDWMLVLLLPLGYAHQLGALRRTRRVGGAGRRACARRVVRTVAALASLACGGVLLVAVARVAWPAVALALAFVAAWHVVENELAMARAAPGAWLPPASRHPARQGLVVLASMGCLAVAASAPGWTHGLLRLGVPAWLATWSAEEVIAALLLHHVVSFGLFAWERADGLPPPARRRRRVALLALHAVPVAVSVGAFLAAPEVSDTLAAPAPYLLASVAHALQTLRVRGAGHVAHARAA